MAAIQAGDVADLLVAAQKDQGKGKITDLTSDLQEHVALSQLMRKSRAVFKSGTAIKFNMLMNPDGNFRNVGLFDVDNVNQEDGLITGEIPWRHSTTGFAFDRRQITMNSGSARILDFYKEKRYMCQAGLVAGYEQNFWEEPAASTDNTTPFGLKYWFVYNETTGFNGGNNTNWSSGPAGVDRDAYARFKNYTFKYTEVSKSDLRNKCRKAMALCRFKPSIPNAPIPQYGSGRVKYGVYTTYDVVQGLEDIAGDQNDKLGPDIDPMSGQVMIQRTLFNWVPYLQENEATPAPVIGIDWDVFRAVFLRGEYMNESAPHPAPLQHTVTVIDIDNSCNFLCYDPRKCWLGLTETWH